ncbi:MAG: DUF5698 domain-containing protein [Peptococcaceae bacterium]|jgi:uncharacterized protein YebE (UPF0316 family)|nr:DUF5698 domain-containing protein [Peptococcaceae bacterium]
MGSTLFVAFPVLAYLFIFLARISDVSLDVFRLLLLMRGYALPASLIGFVQVIIYLLALGVVMYGGFTDPIKIVVYAAGFATGNLIGSYIEKRMAIGYIIIQMFPKTEDYPALLNKLRAASYGVTSILGEGVSGMREVLLVTAKRKSQNNILSLMEDVAPDTFFHISDVRSIHGGVFPNK